MSLGHPIDAVAAFLFRRQLRGACRFHALACGKAPLAVRSKHGLRLRLDPYEYVAAQILAHGYYGGDPACAAGGPACHRRILGEDGPDDTAMKTLLSAAGFSLRRPVRLQPAHPSLKNFVAVR